MGCNHARILMTKRLAGALSPGEGEALAVHLERCAACRREQAEELGFEERLRQLHTAEPSPPAFTVSMETLLVRRRPAPAAKPAPRRSLAITAGLLACTAGALVLGRVASRTGRPNHAAGLSGSSPWYRGANRFDVVPQPGGSRSAKQPPGSSAAPGTLAAGKTGTSPPIQLDGARSRAGLAPESGQPRGTGQAPLTGVRGLPLQPGPAARQVRTAVPGPSPLPHRHAPQRLDALPGPAPHSEDLEYLDGSDAGPRSWMLAGKSPATAVPEALQQLSPTRDSFVRPQPPRFAGTVGGFRGVDGASSQGKGVDSRLFRKITLQLKGASLEELCKDLEGQTGVRTRASRAVMDEKVTVFVKDRPAREVLWAVARLFGWLWDREGEDGSYRYTLVQNTREQVAEQELRDRDFHEALLAADRELQRFTPYLGRSAQELRALERTAPRQVQAELRSLGRRGLLGAVLVYRHLTPAEVEALLAGETLRFGSGAGERPLPPEWKARILESFDPEEPAIGDLARDPEALPSVELRLLRDELGELRLFGNVRLRAGGRAAGQNFLLAGGRSPSTAEPRNAEQNVPLAEDPLFSRQVTLEPRPSCPHTPAAPKAGDAGPRQLADPLVDLPHVTSADVWEEVHRVSGFPVVADFYTRLYPLSRLTFGRVRLFDGLCRAGDAMGVRWRKDGDFLLARSTGYFWDKRKEVPVRQLRRWQEIRKREGTLPLEQVLEIAALSDEQLNSAVVGKAVQHCWGLPEWGILGQGRLEDRGPGALVWSSPEHRRYYRILTLLDPDQLTRALGPQGLPATALSPARQREIARIDPELLKTRIRAAYVPAGWYLWRPRFARGEEPRSRSEAYGAFEGRLPVIGARTAAEALAAARRFYRGATPADIFRQNGTLALWFTAPDGTVVHHQGKPSLGDFRRER